MFVADTSQMTSSRLIRGSLKLNRMLNQLKKVTSWLHIISKLFILDDMRDTHV